MQNPAGRDLRKTASRRSGRQLDYADARPANNSTRGETPEPYRQMRLDRSLFFARGAASAATAAASAATPSAVGRRWGLLANRDFRRLWVVGQIGFAVRWLEMVVVGVFVYRHTGSAFDVAVMTLLRSLPMGLFGAAIGAAADRIERRAALIAVVAALLATDIWLAALAYAGRLAVWHIAVACFLNGVAWAADNPVRRVMIGEAVGHEQMGAAMSIDVGANNASRMLGPTIGGLLFASFGISGCFTVSVICYAVALCAAFGVRRRGGAPAPSGPGTVLTRMIEGFVLVRRDRRLIGTLVITVVSNVFGFPITSLVPVIGQDSLHLGAGGIGMLASMDGIGSFCGAIALALYARPAHYARLYIGGVVLYLVMAIGFGLAPNVPLAGSALLLTGVSNAAFSVMQATLIYMAAPPAMRSRMYGVLSVCIGTSPVGFFAIGLLADAVGAPAATVISGLCGLLALGISRPWWRELATAATA
jgi:MFS family permease